MDDPKLLVAQDIIKYYEEDKVLDINQLEVEGGQVIGLLGPNGSGKTTLIKVLSYLEPAAKRTIFYQGNEVTYETSLQFRRRLGFIWQNPLLYNQSVAENIALGLKFRGLADKQIKQRLNRVLDRLNIRQLKEKNAKLLSGGEQQKVSIARALVTEPEILFIDEPNTSLDPASISLMEEVIKEEAAKGVGIILVTHNFYQAQELADKVVFLEHGQKVTEAPPEEFFAEREELLKYL